MRKISSVAGVSYLAFAAMLFFGLPANATTVIATPVSKIAKTSNMIVDATVIDQSVWRDQESGRIYTSSMLQIHDWIRGDKPQSVVEFRQLGGEIDGLSMWIPGAYRLAVGERVILLGLEHQGTMIAWGLGQGKFGVQKYEGALMAAPSFGGVDFVEVDENGNIKAAEPDFGMLTLEALKAKIRTAVEGGVAQ